MAPGALLASLALTLTACHGRDISELDAAINPSTPGVSAEGVPADPEVESELAAPPDTAAGRQLAWVLEAVNERGHMLSAHEIEEHFGAIFISVMTTESIQDEFASLSREAAPLELLEISPDTSEISLLALIDGSSGPLTVGMNIEEETGKIAVIQFGLLLELVPLVDGTTP
jgi:hypothetical protein